MSSRRVTHAQATRKSAKNTDYSHSSLDLELKSADAQARRTRANTFTRFAERRRAAWKEENATR